MTPTNAPEPEREAFEATDFQLERLFDAAHEHGQFGREFREHARSILATPPLPDLHAQIMNLPCKVPHDANVDQTLAWKYGHKQARHAAAELASAALASSPAVQAVPAGWRLVPVEPTAEMVNAGRNALHHYAGGVKAASIGAHRGCWASMLASAPQAPAPEPIQTQDSGHQAERLIPDAHRDGEASS